MKYFIFALFILSISVKCTDPFDYLLFVQEVPGTVCSMKNCNPYYGKMLDKQLNMHGMWPNYNNGSWPASCYKASSYSDNDLPKDVLTDLNNRWIGLFSSVQSFRNHEWLKHGTCYIEGLQTEQNIDANMTKYFKDTMDSQKKLDLSSVVFSKCSWKIDDLQQALSNKVGGKKIFFDCNGNNLYNIKACLDKNLNIIDCPSSVSGGGKCKSTVLVPNTPKELIKNGTGPEPPTKVFDYLLFVLENTGAACLQRKCKRKYGTLKQNTLNMHGMWPNFESGGYPQNCFEAPAYSDKLIKASTFSMIEDNWIGVFADGETFRNHEWLKHGTCYIKGVEQKTDEQTNEVNEQMDKYFADALNTKISLDLDSIIFSRSSWKYTYLYYKIKDKIGHHFQMDCDKKNNLLELKICLTPDLKVRDCPSTLESHRKCKQSKNIKILPVPHAILRETNDEENTSSKQKFLE